MEIILLFVLFLSSLIFKIRKSSKIYISTKYLFQAIEHVILKAGAADDITSG